MDIVWLQDFIALEREGSFSRAAKTRNVTQPAFSRRVRALETWVATPLFERTSRGIVLTAAGRVFSRGAADLLEATMALRARAREAGEGADQTLRFAATQTLSFTFFPEWIRRSSHHDLGHVQLNTANMATCEEIMRQGGAQFLLCHGHSALETPFAGELPFVRVGEDRLVAVQGRGGGGTLPVPTKGSAPWPYLAYGATTGIGRILEACQARWMPPAGCETVFTSHLSAALRQLACDGAGLAWLPLSLIAADLEGERLLRVFPVEDDIAIDILLFRTNVLSRNAERFWRTVAAA